MTKLVLSVVVAALLSFAAAPASAHVTERSGSFAVELGWGVEPPRAGAENFVEVNVADARGGAVAVAGGALSVEVVYGAAALTLPLTPTADPGRLEARLTPTRPGTYSFHVTGTVAGRPLDVSATCSEATFECVDAAAAGPQFPVEDPSAGELAQRLGSEAERVDAAGDEASSARTLALVALALAAIAAAIAIAARRRAGSG